MKIAFLAGVFSVCAAALLAGCGRDAQELQRAELERRVAKLEDRCRLLLDDRAELREDMGRLIDAVVVTTEKNAATLEDLQRLVQEMALAVETRERWEGRVTYWLTNRNPAAALNFRQ